MDRIGLDLVAKKKKNVVASEQDSDAPSQSRDRDLLSCLVRANVSEDPTKRLPDNQVLAREFLQSSSAIQDVDVFPPEIPIFILAGHETTSNGLAWTLFALAQRPDVQERLRAECRSSLTLPTLSTGNDPLTAEEVNALDKLPLLDAVIRESLRLYPPILATMRAATEDDAIPLAHPYTDKKGVLRDTIPMHKGAIIPIPILSVNRSKDIWGPDALEWNPDRWLAYHAEGVPAAAKGIPNVWGPLLTFISGSHACIGWRFSLMETKIILHTLMSEFAFKLAVDPSEVFKKNTGIVYQPHLKGEKDKGAQLPLLVSRIPRD
jgi:cytochrome P450